MVANVSDVLSAYKKVGGIIDDAGDAATPASASPGAGGGASFSDALKSFSSDVISSLHSGETAATQAVTGKADMASVVTAMDNAEIVLEEVTAIRDKVISAYQSITSTAI